MAIQPQSPSPVCGGRGEDGYCQQREHEKGALHGHQAGTPAAVCAAGSARAARTQCLTLAACQCTILQPMRSVKLSTGQTTVNSAGIPGR